MGSAAEEDEDDERSRPSLGRGPPSHPAAVGHLPSLVARPDPGGEPADSRSRRLRVVAARIEKGAASGLSDADVEARFGDEGLSARPWGNGPGDTYGWHEHGYHKVLYCVQGSIVFHTRDGDVALEAGDRLDVEPGTEHAATVGPDGCRCVEAATG